MKTLNPDDIQRRFEQAIELHRYGKLPEALAGYDAVLAADARHAGALHLSGLLLFQDMRSGEALMRMEQSLAIDPSVSDVWSNTGLVYQSLGRAADAAAALERAVELEPTLAEGWLNLSSQRLTMEEAVPAEAAARRALSIAPMPGAWFNLALALKAQGRNGEGLEALNRFDTLLANQPLNVASPGLRAQILIADGQREAARRVLDQALATVDDTMLRLERAQLCASVGDVGTATNDYNALLRPNFGTDATRELALSELIFLRKQHALWDGLPLLQAAFRERVAFHMRNGDAGALTPFSFLSDPSTRAEQRSAGEVNSRRYEQTQRLPTRALSTGRLKIGYLSADLHDHATGILSVGLFEQHDRERFETFAYSTGPDDGSAQRLRLVAAFDHFVDAQGWSEPSIADRIAADGIDILVDLKGHTERASTVTMAMRPAPIAVSYLGYPATMGASFVDYLIGDRIVTPLAHAKDYSETLVQLPHCYQINDDRRAIGPTPTRGELGLPDDAIVLCCFNSIYKINPEVLDAWVEILRQVPNAVLWMQTHANDGATRDRLLRELVMRGIAADRVVFAESRPHADYLALYRCADLFLDTWPYTAHTTASDALWAGCPVLTLQGETFAGRVAASLLTAVGMTSGIVPDRINYIATAVAWCNDRDRLTAMRKQLEATAKSSPLFDTQATTRAIEAAYLAMGRQFKAGRRAPILVNSDFTVAG